MVLERKWNSQDLKQCSYGLLALSMATLPAIYPSAGPTSQNLQKLGQGNTR